MLKLCKIFFSLFNDLSYISDGPIVLEQQLDQELT